MIRVNLVPQDILDRELQKQRLGQIGVIGVFAALLFAGVSYWHHHRKVVLEAEVATAKTELAALEKYKSMLAEATARRDKVVARRKVIEGLLSSRLVYPRFMTDISESMPKGMWLETLKTTNKTNTTLQVDADAAVLKPENAAQWLRGVNASTQPVQLTGGGRFSAGQTKILTIGETATKFTINMTYTAAP
ncbi:MAG: hypothetical protein WC728_04710 [Elusimicrobiota bacterium]